MMSDQITLIINWHNAVNSKSLPALQTFVTADVAIGGPRGVAQGIEALLDWVSHANIKLQPIRVFAKDNIILVEQLAQWGSQDSSSVLSESTVYTIFKIMGNHITSILRYDDKATAFEVAQLTEMDVIEM